MSYSWNRGQCNSISRSHTRGTGKDKGKRHPTVENNVTIGSGAKVLRPILMGEGAKIGGNAVVLKDIPKDTNIFELSSFLKYKLIL